MAATLDLGNLLVHLNLDASQYHIAMKQVEGRMKVASQRLTAMGRKMSLRVTAPIVAMGALSVKAFASFDDAMTKSLAIMSDITPAIRQEMEALALSISNEGVTSAKDLAKGYFFLASAGLDAAQSMAALGAVERFAVAGAFDLATATDLATDAQSALGLTVKDAQINLENMTRVTDVLVGANTLANATTEQFSLALTSGAGPAMKAYNIQLEEGVAVLAAYADQGIKAQNAGNLFSRMLRLTTKGFKDNEAAWKQFNLNIFTAAGELKPMSVIINDLSNVLGEMSTKQKIATLAMLGFQARSQQAILPLLGLGDRIEKYTEQLEGMSGITREVAEKQLKSFTSQMKILKNQIVNVGIEIGKILAPAILSLNEKIKNLITAWKELDLITKKWVITLAGIAAAIGPILIFLGVAIKLLLFMKVALVLVTVKLLLLSKALLVLLVAHPVAAAILLLVGRLAQLAFQYNAIRVNFIKLNGLLISSNDLLKQHKKRWEEIADTIKQTRQGRIIQRQLETTQRLLEQKLGELKFLKKDFEDLNFFDKFLQGPSRQSVINRLTLEIAVLEKRFKTLGEQGKRQFDIIEETAKKVIPTLDPIVPQINAIEVAIAEAGQGIADSMVSNLTDSITGVQSWAEAVLNIVNDMTRMITQAFVRMFLQQVFQSSLFSGLGLGGFFGPPGTAAAVPVVGASQGGIVNPVYAARGFVPKGTDTVPAMLTPGEMVVSKPVTDLLLRQSKESGGGGGGRGNMVNINVSAIDAQNTFQFLDKNKNAIASMLQSAGANNHPFRRRQS